MVEYLVLPIERELYSHQITVCWQGPDVQCSPAPGISCQHITPEVQDIAEGCAGIIRQQV